MNIASSKNKSKDYQLLTNTLTKFGNAYCSFGILIENSITV